MAALAADTLMPHKGTPTKLSVACTGADVFYKNAIVYADAAGTAQVTAPAGAGGDYFLGICAEQVTTTAAGDLVDIYVDGLFAIAFLTPDEADVGDVCVADISGTPTDNQADLETGADATLVGNDILIGKILAIDAEETTRGWVQIQPGWIYSAALGWV